MSRQGPPKHQNKYAWKPRAGVKINETELGGRLKPYSEITGVCPRCKGQIEWKRRYGKYKPLAEPAKCQRCSKRSIRQAHHNLCPACAKEQNVCAKCCCRVDRIVGRDISDVEAERKMLEEALQNARERDRRALLRAMSKGKSPRSITTTTTKESNGGASTTEEFADTSNNEDEEEDEDEDKVCD